MEIFIENILWNLTHIDWEGSAMFAIVILSVLAIFKQWHILLLTLLFIVLGWGAQDIMIMNVETDMRIMSLPFFIYCLGSGIVIILSLISFLKLAV